MRTLVVVSIAVLLICMSGVFGEDKKCTNEAECICNNVNGDCYCGSSKTCECRNTNGNCFCQKAGSCLVANTNGDAKCQGCSQCKIKSGYPTNGEVTYENGASCATVPLLLGFGGAAAAVAMFFHSKKKGDDRMKMWSSWLWLASWILFIILAISIMGVSGLGLGLGLGIPMLVFGFFCFLAFRINNAMKSNGLSAQWSQFDDQQDFNNGNWVQQQPEDVYGSQYDGGYGKQHGQADVNYGGGPPEGETQYEGGPYRFISRTGNGTAAAGGGGSAPFLKIKPGFRGTGLATTTPATEESSTSSSSSSTNENNTE